MKKYKNTKRQLIVLFILPLALVLIWFWKSYLFAGGEEGIPFYNLGRTYSLYFPFRESDGGYLNQEVIARIPTFALLKILEKFGFSGVFLQAFVFFFLMFTGTISMYFLLHHTLRVDFSFPKKSYLLYFYTPLVGAVFYLLNPFSMIQIWGRGIYSQFFPFALFPLFLLLIILGLKKKNIIYGLFALISSFIFSAAFSNLSYVMTLWFLIFLYFVFYTFKNKKEAKFVIFFLIYLLLGFIATNFWWIYYNTTTLVQTATSRTLSLEHDLGTLRGVSRTYNLFIVLQLLHHFLTKAEYYGKVYYTIPFRLVSLIIPISFLFSFSIFKKLKSFRFYIILFLASFFVVMGSNIPLGWLFTIFFKIFSPMRAFRNPYEKMGLVFLIAYTPFISIGMVRMSEKICDFIKKKKDFKNIRPALVLVFLIFLTCVVYLWPMWAGKFAGGIKYNPWIQVPGYYKETNDWLNDNKSGYKTIHLPLNPGDGARYVWAGGVYQGIEPSMFLFDGYQISTHSNYNKNYYNVLLERFNILQPGFYGPDPDITQSEFRSNSFREELEKLNVRFIVLHNDVDYEFYKSLSPQEFADYLSKQEGIEKVVSFGKLDIYEVDNDPEVGLIYSPQVKTDLEKYNSGFFKIKVMDSREAFDLYFLQNFDQNWNVFVDGKEVSSQKRVFSYANAWRIDKIGNFTIELRYIPQGILERGARISLAGFIVLLLFSLVTLKLKKKDQISSIN